MIYDYICQDCKLFCEYLLIGNKCPSCGSTNALVLRNNRYVVIHPNLITTAPNLGNQAFFRLDNSSTLIREIENLDWSNLDAVDRFIFNNRHNSGNDKSSVLFRETLERAAKEAVLNSHESLAETLILTLKKRAINYPELIGYAQHVAIHNKQMKRVIYNTLREYIIDGVVGPLASKSAVKSPSKDVMKPPSRDAMKSPSKTALTALLSTLKKNKYGEIDIKSREFWFRYEEPMAKYWALISRNNNNDFYTVFFIIDWWVSRLGYEGPISAIFDSLEFDCMESAIEGLRRNQFLKVDEFHKIFIPAQPLPPFVKLPLSKLYSKQDGLWKYE